MNQFLQLVGVLFAVAILVIVFVLEMAGHLDVIQNKFPSVWVIMHSRPIMFALLIAILVFLQRDFKDALPTYLAPLVKVAPPPAPVIQATNTAAPPIVNVPEQKRRAYMLFAEPTIHYVPGSSLSIDFGCKTISEVPAVRVACSSKYFIIPVYGGVVKMEDEDAAYQNFEESAKLDPESERPTVQKDEFSWGNYRNPALTKDDLSRIDNGAVVLVTGKLLYEDDAGFHRINFCRYIATPLMNTPRTWRYCHHHEGVAN